VPVTLTVGAIGSGNLIVSPSSLTFNYFLWSAVSPVAVPVDRVEYRRVRSVQS
jgi:hypothetical protein